MYCRNCGTQYSSEQAVICVKCGVQKGVGNRYCWNCGSEVNPNSAVCINCGVALENTSVTNPNSKQKSKIIAGLLAIFFGSLGVHNFYLGQTGKGIIHLVLTIVGALLFAGPFISEVWALIEAIYIFTGKIDADAHGNKLSD